MGFYRISKKISEYGTLVMFKHTIFSFSFALVSLLIATGGQMIGLGKIVLIFITLLSARTGANAINRVIDAEIDGRNPRTQDRQIPQKTMGKREALIFSLVCFAIMVVAAFFINSLCAWLSPIALFFLVFYSYTKRFTFLCHLFLGFTCSLAPMGAYLAVTGNFGGLTESFLALGHLDVGLAFQSFVEAFEYRDGVFTAIFLMMANMFWVAGFDIIYGAQDVDFDRANGIHSIPAKLGVKQALWISSAFHFLAVLFLVAAKFFTDLLGAVYLIGIGIVGVLLIVEHRIISEKDLKNVKLASYHINEVIGLVFLIFSIASIIWQ